MNKKTKILSVIFLGIIVAAMLLVRFFVGLNYVWNGLRLLPALSVLKGYSLYYPLDAGPLIPRAYPPIGLLAYLPIGFFSTPNAAVLAGQMLSAVIAFGASAIFLFKADAAQSLFSRALSFIFLILLSLSFISASAVACDVHVDASALALLIGACALTIVALKRSPKQRARIAAGAGALFAMACFAKQTLIFAPLGVFVVLWLERSTQLLLPILRSALVTGILMLTVCLLIYGGDQIYYQWFAYLKNFPSTRAWSETLAAVTFEWVPLTGLLGLGVFLFRKKIPRSSLLPIKLLLGAAIAMSVISVPAFRKDQGGFNSLGFTTFLIVLALAKLLQIGLAKFEKRKYVSASTAGILMLWGLMGLFSWRLELQNLPRFLKNQTQLGYETTLRHPEEVYIPYIPLATFMADRKLYHSGTELLDRFNFDLPFKPEHFRAFLPAKLKFIVITPEGRHLRPMEPILNFLPEFSVQTRDPKYPEWLIITKKNRG